MNVKEYEDLKARIDNDTDAHNRCALPWVDYEGVDGPDDIVKMQRKGVLRTALIVRKPSAIEIDIVVGSKDMRLYLPPHVCNDVAKDITDDILRLWGTIFVTE